jgi:hypothetical protein
LQLPQPLSHDSSTSLLLIDDIHTICIFYDINLWILAFEPVVSFPSDDLKTNRLLSIESSFTGQSWHIFFGHWLSAASWLAPFSCVAAVGLILAIWSRSDQDQWLAFICY